MIEYEWIICVALRSEAGWNGQGIRFIKIAISEFSSGENRTEIDKLA